MTGARRTWRELAIVGACAAGTLVGADVAIARLVPPAHQREVEDAMRELAAVAPEVLVLGSSHARTWDVLEDIARTELDDAPEIVSVPLEFGRLAGYLWVLEHRIRPLLDARDASGQPHGRSLRNLVLVTEWWDSLPTVDRFEANVPSRAFTWSSFAGDVLAHGIDDLNRNFLAECWRQLWFDSALVQDRGNGRIYPALRALVGRAQTDEDPAATLAERIAWWQSMIEDGARDMLDVEQMDALRAILRWAQDSGLRTTIVLYPRKPATLTARARETTLARYSSAVRALAAEFGADFQDDTTLALVTDEMFQPDFDHLTPEGHDVYSRYLLRTAMAEVVAAGKNR